jgi:hypothetical protein
MKQTTITQGICSRSVSPLTSASLQSRGMIQQNKMYLLFLYPKPNAMKTIFTLILALFIQVSAFSQVTSFTGTLKNDRVDLKWATLTEKNVSHFIIEKSIDGKNYSQAGLVFAYGNSSETMSYPFFEKNINTSREGMIYYRLSSVTNDGKIELAGVTTITIVKKGEK